MRILLASLMCLTLATSQAFAHKGGPVYPGSKVSTTGTYAGVMFPSSHAPACKDNNGNPVFCQGQPTTLNQIGLFSFPIPTTGLGTGSAVLFNQGQIYTGTIQATADADTAAVNGIFSATFPYIITIQTGTDSNNNPIFTTQTVSAQASGKLAAQISAVSNGLSNSVRLDGTADVQFALTVNNPFDEIIFNVFGFKQASL